MSFKQLVYLAKRKVQFAFANISAITRNFPNRNAYRPLPDKPNILFIMSGLLGDTVMSTTAILASREYWPGCQITVLGKKANIELLSGLRAIDNLKETSFIPFSFTKKNDKNELITWLRDKQFDIAIILLGDEFAKILLDAKIPVRVGVKGHPLSVCHTHLYDIISPKDWGPTERLNALRCLGYEMPFVLPKLENVPAAISNWRLLKERIGLPDHYVILHPFGSTKRQWWCSKKVQALITDMYIQQKLQTVIIGGAETKSVNLESAGLIDSRGALSLTELKMVIANAILIISTDSGPLHIGGAFDKKIIGLFRRTRPELASIYPNVKPVFGENSLCQKLCKWDRCRLDICAQMNSIDSQKVLEKEREFYD